MILRKHARRPVVVAQTRELALAQRAIMVSFLSNEICSGAVPFFACAERDRYSFPSSTSRSRSQLRFELDDSIDCKPDEQHFSVKGELGFSEEDGDQHDEKSTPSS